MPSSPGAGVGVPQENVALKTCNPGALRMLRALGRPRLPVPSPGQRWQRCRCAGVERLTLSLGRWALGLLGVLSKAQGLGLVTPM